MAAVVAMTKAGGRASVPCIQKLTLPASNGSATAPPHHRPVRRCAVAATSVAATAMATREGARSAASAVVTALSGCMSAY